MKVAEKLLTEVGSHGVSTIYKWLEHEGGRGEDGRRKMGRDLKKRWRAVRKELSYRKKKSARRGDQGKKSFEKVQLIC
ncbi:hypothetical protein HK101_008267 [Irineochytrium annulatum]|nr:hypothetical protein HK101_008267 [Irineochytrium annulatum]